MTNPVIEEIYLVVAVALEKGQTEVPVHVFPFPLSLAKLEAHSTHPASALWKELLPAYELFEKHRHVPNLRLVQGAYEVKR